MRQIVIYKQNFVNRNDLEQPSISWIIRPMRWLSVKKGIVPQMGIKNNAFVISVRFKLNNAIVKMRPWRPLCVLPPPFLGVALPNLNRLVAPPSLLVLLQPALAPEVASVDTHS